MHHDDEMDHEEGARSFAHFLMQANSGAMASDTSFEFRRMVDEMRRVAMQSNGASADFTLKIHLTLDDSDEVRVKFSARGKVSEPTRRKGTMWLSRGGNLIPENPRQQRLPLTEVPYERTPIKDLG